MILTMHYSCEYK